MAAKPLSYGLADRFDRFTLADVTSDVNKYHYSLFLSHQLVCPSLFTLVLYELRICYDGKCESSKGCTASSSRTGRFRLFTAIQQQANLFHFHLPMTKFSQYYYETRFFIGFPMRHLPFEDLDGVFSAV